MRFEKPVGLAAMDGMEGERGDNSIKRILAPGLFPLCATVTIDRTQVRGRLRQPQSESGAKKEIELMTSLNKRISNLHSLRSLWARERLN